MLVNIEYIMFDTTVLICKFYASANAILAILDMLVNLQD